MRLKTIRIADERTTAARIDRRRTVPLPFSDVGAIISAGPGWQDHTTGSEAALPAAATAAAAPLITGLTLLTQVAVNYAARAKEIDVPRPVVPELFTTPIDLLVGEQDTVRIDPAPSAGWGVELGIVIGGETSRVSVAEALHHVAGYTTVNSIAVPGRAALVAIGPQLVTPDELPLGARGLTLTAFHNGRLRQKANTSDLLFDVATLIAHASATTTLMPGDLITTGTPAGTATDPIHDGSELIVAIKGIGELHTTITCQPDR